MKQHPRFKHYPHHMDYGFRHTFRPFVTFVQPPNYRSKAVNIDAYGMREQYDAAGRFIDLGAARREYPSCTVVLGGSVAFGMGVSSDRHTFSARLSEPERPCLNLAVRAATSRHELAVFLALRHLLPDPEMVILFSGVNECLLASSPRVVVYPGYGAAFAEHIQQFQQGDGDGVPRESGAPPQMHAALDRMVRRGRDLAKRGRPPHDGGVIRSDPNIVSFEDRLECLLALAADTLVTWGALQAASRMRVCYVLQPLAPWTSKPLTEVEHECVDADLGTIAGLEQATDGHVYHRLKAVITSACAEQGISFFDANVWLGSDTTGQEIFSDIAHLTDHGNVVIAEWMRREVMTVVTQ